MDMLREHSVTLRDGEIVLRPMTENDWDVLYRWNNDPEVLHYADGPGVTGRSLAEVHGMYRGVSRAAFVFMIELGGLPIGECWLQRMNLPHILDRHPASDCRRIDLTIGEKAHWGQGIGSRVIRMLTAFGFETEGADRIYGCCVADYNVRSRRAFEGQGYGVEFVTDPQPGELPRRSDLVITRNAT